MPCKMTFVPNDDDEDEEEEGEEEGEGCIPPSTSSSSLLETLPPWVLLLLLSPTPLMYIPTNVDKAASSEGVMEERRTIAFARTMVSPSGLTLRSVMNAVAILMGSETGVVVAVVGAIIIKSKSTSPTCKTLIESVFVSEMLASRTIVSFVAEVMSIERS